MGNNHCVPQAPRRLRASFSRKPSLKGNRGDSARKPAGLFGAEACPDGDTAADKIFHYIPGTDIPGLESQPENLEQPFLSVFKKGRRKTPVRNLGKVVHYAKVQLRFQHSQDISDCYLELFPSHLYFQAHGSEGLTFQGLLPLMELSICRLEGSREHAFQITGPLPAPLLVLCHSEAELSRWLYHLEKQMALMGGLRRCHSAPPQGPPGNELPWTLQHSLTRLQRASGCKSVGSAICASRVKLQHLPSQEQWDRLLILYPTSLAIFSEESDGLGFKGLSGQKTGLCLAGLPGLGELPLSAIHINLEEKEKQIRSFLIEGRFINTIRVICANYEDYSQWLLCLRTVSLRDGVPLLPGSESFSGLQGSAQALSGGRGSLSSDGRTSWNSGCPGASTCTSYSLPESSVPSTTGCSAQSTTDQPDPDSASLSQRRRELRRRGSSQSPRGKVREVPSLATPLPLHLDLTKVSRPGLESGLEAPDYSLDIPHSPLYADPYTPPATSHRKITDIQDVDEFLRVIQTSSGLESSSLFPSVPVSVPVSDSRPGISRSPGSLGPQLLSKKSALKSRASQRHQGSVKGRGTQPPDSPQLATIAREGAPSPLPPTDGEAPIWDKISSPSHQKWSRLKRPAVEGGLIQWI